MVQEAKHRFALSSFRADMISQSQINELKTQWQTTELNIAREYVQSILLSGLYSHPEVNLAFKGGTALRLLRRSPRFSEDLDFTGWGKPYHVGEWIKASVKESGNAGLEFETLESNPTSGGWFASVRTHVHQWPVEIEWNVSLRGQKKPDTETVLVTTPLWPAYSVKALSQDTMIEEKLSAALSRKEPRDFYDLYFILRDRLSVKVLIPKKKEIIQALKSLEPRRLKNELNSFLPRSHRAIIAQLPHLLRRELERL